MSVNDAVLFLVLTFLVVTFTAKSFGNTRLGFLRVILQHCLLCCFSSKYAYLRMKVMGEMLLGYLMDYMSSQRQSLNDNIYTSRVYMSH